MFYNMQFDKGLKVATGKNYRFCNPATLIKMTLAVF